MPRMAQSGEQVHASMSDYFAVALNFKGNLNDVHW